MFKLGFKNAELIKVILTHTHKGRHADEVKKETRSLMKCMLNWQGYHYVQFGNHSIYWRSLNS